MTARPDYVKIAARFRDYAALCRAQADDTALCEYRPALLKMAERWERDAERVPADGYIVATSLTMINSIGPYRRALITGE